MAREHRVLSSLARTLSFVPDSILLCEDRSVLGTPFHMIEFRQGVVVRGDDLSELTAIADAPAKLSAMMVDTLAAIHAVDPASVELDTLGRPEGFLARTIKGWQGRGHRLASGDLIRDIDTVADVLSAYEFAPRRPCLLHNDFKLDNIILYPKGLTPAGVIDWDMCTRGDPLFDLAVLLSYWTQADDGPALRALRQMPTTQPGFWTRAQAAQRYSEKTGCDLADLPVLRVLALLRLGVVFLQLHDQFRTGATTDSRYAAFGEIGAGIIRHARECVTTSGRKP